MHQSCSGSREAQRRQPWRGGTAPASGASRIVHHRSRKARLPWLDGSQSRHGSIPLVPGAYLDDAAVNTSRDVTAAHANEPDQNIPPVPDRTASSIAPSPTQKSLSGPVVLPSSRPSQFPAMTKNDTSPLTATAPESGARPTQPPAEKVTGRPALPVLALARELYPTDSSGISDSETERSIRQARRRTLMEPPVPAIPHTVRASDNPTMRMPTYSSSSKGRPSRFGKGQSEVDSPRSISPRHVDEDKLSPLELQKKFSNTVGRRSSMIVQPIRQCRVTIAPDDLSTEALMRRKQSLSVQPLRNRRISKSFDEDLSGDLVKISRSSHWLAEKRLRKSIASLEDLMQEAVCLAKDAADHGRSNEVPAIMDEARLALHRASVVQIVQRGACSSKPRRSESASEFSTGSSSSYEGSPAPLPVAAHTRESKPKSKGRSILPTKDGPLSDASSGGEPTTPHGMSRTIWDEEWPNHRVEDSGKAKLPRAVDFAYNQPLLSSSEGETTSRIAGLNDQQRRPQLIRTGTLERQRITVPLTEASAGATPNSVSLTGRYVVGTTDGPMSPRQQADDTSEHSPVGESVPEGSRSRKPSSNWGRDKYDDNDYAPSTNELRGKRHITLRDGQHFSLQHGYKRQPIARNWTVGRKRFVAAVTCMNTALVGILIGVYAGEVPAIQYTLADLHHQIILGNVYLYIGMAITSFLFWPLPLLHGRKPYTLVALGLALPLQIPQAIIVQTRRAPISQYSGYMAGLLVSRGLLGLALGFAHMNFKATLLDLYGASLQSEFPHGEHVITDDVRRHGGGMGYWLGIWSFCFLGSLALGFFVGAAVISGTNPSWGFYICAILVAIALFLNVLTPETRRSPHRRTMQEVELPNDSISRRVARGEIKMHVSGDGPKWWWEEVLSGVYLSLRMLVQSGLLVIAFYMAWIYAQIVLIIVVRSEDSGPFLIRRNVNTEQLLGNLLSTQYVWKPQYVALGVLGICVGALLAIPNSKANFFSRSRVNPPRTDSMTFQPRFGWSSHLVRRALFMIALPLAGLAYTLSSVGRQVQYMVPIVFAAVIGYISNLAMAECNGIIMETFDTSDLQPGTNSRHRLQSLSAATKSRRTTYTSYPRVSAGIFTAQAVGFLFAAAATGVGGAVTRTVGAQSSTAITAGILLFLTLLLTLTMLRFRVVQVIPNELFGHYFGASKPDANRRERRGSIDSDKSWRAVVIGNPSGKNRRMNWLELGSLSRWTEIRRLNRLLNRSTTQALNPGWQ